MAETPNVFSLDDFMAHFDGGQRAYLFYFLPSFPTYTGLTYMFQVRSLSTPSVTLEDVNVQMQGRDFKSGGKTTYDDFTVTFTADNSGNLMKEFLGWVDRNIQGFAESKRYIPRQYLRDQNLFLLNNVGEPTLHYQLIDAFPSSIGAVSMAYDSNEIATFDVTFKYQYFLVDSVTTKTLRDNPALYNAVQKNIDTVGKKPVVKGIPQEYPNNPNRGI